MSTVRTYATDTAHSHPEHASRPDTARPADALTGLSHQQRSLQQQLQRIVATSTDMNSAAEKIARIAATVVKASFLSFVRPGQETPLDALATVGDIASAPDIDYPFLQSLCLRTIDQGTVLTRNVSAHDDRTVVAMPIQLDGTHQGVIVALLERDSTPIAKRMLIMDLVSYAFQQWDTQDRIEQLDWEAQTASAITDLISQIESSPSHDYACLLAANVLNDHFGARRSAIGLVGRGASVTLTSISGKAEFDRQSPLAQQLTAAMDETLVREDLTTWPAHDEHARHATLQHRKLAEAQNEEALVSIPLKTVDGTTLGVWLSSGPKEALHNDRQLNALRSIAPHLATAINVRKAADPGLVRSAINATAGKDRRVARMVAAMGATLLFVLPLLPIQYRIKSAATVEPVQHRFVTVPFNGVLKETFVRPGDRVTTGQLLAVMDERELGWELNALTAQAGIASKKRDAATATHDIHEKQLAILEKENLNQKIKVLQHRKQNLEIVAGLDGVILKGDLEEAHGAPVKIGDSLFEIAPLAPLKLEVAIPEDEIAYVAPGMSVTARLDGHPTETIQGTIETLHPRSEIRDNRNVFVAEVLLDNSDHQLRPGMSGRARVLAGRRSLGWIWLHKAVYRVRSAMGV